jgi:predicted RND superfamily exporter protein
LCAQGLEGLFFFFVIALLAPLSLLFAYFMSESGGLSFMRSYGRFVVRYAGLIAAIGTLLGGVATYYTVKLFMNLRTEIEELLPTNARSVVDMKEIAGRLETVENIALVIDSENPVKSKEFVIALANALEKGPKELVSRVEYRIDREIAFFKSRQALFVEVPDLEKIRDYVKDKIDYEKKLYNPLNIFSGENIPEPALDFEVLKRKYLSRTSRFDHFPEGFYASEDEKRRIVLVYINGKVNGIVGGQRLKEFVVKTVAEVDPARYAPDLSIHYTGGIQEAHEEHEALIEDLVESTVIVVVIVAIAMWVFFRGVRATVALLGSLIVGTLWTFGVSFFAVGYLNANSAFMASIVIGNGINFAIIVLARYIEERRKRKTNDEAVETACSMTATSTLVAALAAGLSYGSLMVTDFRGFSQFGVIGLIGMILCWISAFTILPAYLTIFDRLRTLVPADRRVPKPYVGNAVAWFVSKFPRLILGFSLALTVLSVVLMLRVTPDVLERDLTKLRNIDSIKKGAHFYSKKLDKIFKYHLSPLVVLSSTREGAHQVAEKLKEYKEQAKEQTVVENVAMMDDFVPKQQAEKIKILKQIKALLPPAILLRLSPADRALAEQFLSEDSLRGISQEDLPELVKSRFREKDGSLGKLVVAEPPLNGLTDEVVGLVKMVTTVRRVADESDPQARVAGTMAVTSDMFDAVQRDGPRATLTAFALVILLVVVLMRQPRAVIMTLTALVVGVIWLAGFILGYGVKINFLNFIALPITFGIGVDYAVNMFQRFREEPDADILDVIRYTGGAVMLCSFTTITGYFSLLIARNQGFVSFGLLAVAGEITCLIAAVLTLPSIVLLLRRRMTRDGKRQDESKQSESTPNRRSTDVPAAHL